MNIVYCLVWQSSMSPSPARTATTAKGDPGCRLQLDFSCKEPASWVQKGGQSSLISYEVRAYESSCSLYIRMYYQPANASLSL